MATVEITAANFDDLTDDGIVLWTSGRPGAARVASSPRCVRGGVRAAPGRHVRQVDTEVERALAQGFAITSIPTIMVIRDGVIVFQQLGALNA